MWELEMFKNKTILKEQTNETKIGEDKPLKENINILS